MDKNSELTNTYKAEITDILSKISEGLSCKVTSAIKPEIDNISSNVESQFNLVKKIEAENKRMSGDFKQRIESFEETFNRFEKTTENLQQTFEHQNADFVSSIEKNNDVLSQLNKSYGVDLLFEIRKVSNNEEVKSINVEVTQLKAKLKTTEKLLFTTLVFLLVLSSLIVSLIYK